MRHTLHAGRLLIVSNRLPVTVRSIGAGIELTSASGGLATGLGPWHERSSGRWIGWPGDVSLLSTAQREQAESRLRARGIVPVHLTRDLIDRYYHGFANRVLWPLFHYLIDRIPVDAAGWDAYRDANEAFAEATAAAYRAGDTVWVHDYQLLLLPALLRKRLPDARIGFFLHIPFPSSEVFRVLPWRREILDGLLGADLIGFHTFAYLRHFVASLLHVRGLEADLDVIRIGGREIRLGVFPMGIDARSFSTLASSPQSEARTADIRAEAGGRAIVLGIDRLDYTKGIPRRLQAFERLLERNPGLVDKVRYIQVAVPSRGEVDSYQRFKRQVEEGVGRINGRFGTLRSTPVHYVQRSLPQEELVALYRAADVMLVTPLRDGMNLVAKEFVASRIDGDGVLVLSEFAGASSELDGSILVNPYDVDAVAETLHRALSLPAHDRRIRMQTLRRRVMGYDVHAWAADYLSHLRDQSPAEPLRAGNEASAAIARACRTTPVRLLLDYEGTLVPLARSPELASPDGHLETLLDDVCRIPWLRPALVSGRPRGIVERWFGHLPVELWAEHGFWHRPADGSPWLTTAAIDERWAARLIPIFKDFTERTPGSRVEVKTAAIAWHFRGAEREFGARQAHELRMLLGDFLSNQPLEVLEGKKVIEVRFRGISKAIVAQMPPVDCLSTATIAFGDDRTDEELFRALPASSITIAVGQALASAQFRVQSFREVRLLLRQLVASNPKERDRGALASPRSV